MKTQGNNVATCCKSESTIRRYITDNYSEVDAKKINSYLSKCKLWHNSLHVIAETGYYEYSVMSNDQKWDKYDHVVNLHNQGISTAIGWQLDYDRNGAIIQFFRDIRIKNTKREVYVDGWCSTAIEYDTVFKK